MPFPGPLLPNQIDVVRQGGFFVDQFVLVWEQDIIFQAQINQSSFDSAFAQLTYDNVTIGAYTDIKSDFTCYVDSTAGNITTPSHTFRVRADESYVVATSSVLNINETSAALSNNWYIMVVKDVKIKAKLPRTLETGDPTANTYNRDYAITYRRLLPTVTDLQTCYAGTLNSDGVFDLELEPTEFITDNDTSSISTWLWEPDGLAFQDGTSASQDVTLRATASGQYMPRLTITDNTGLKNYFTFKVWVVPSGYSGIVRLPFGAATINGDNTNGWSTSLDGSLTNQANNQLRLDDILDGSFCAIWYPGHMPTITSDILMCGWLRKEKVTNAFTPDNNVSLSTVFELEGVAKVLSRIISRRMAIIEDSTPTVFGEVEDLTPWRAVMYFLTEHTTLLNLCSLTFSDVSEIYRYPRFGTGDSSALASVIDLLFTINAGLNYAPTGEMEAERKAWMVPNSNRNALATVMSMTTQDMATSKNGGLLFDIERDYVKPVGREVAGGGVYNTSSSSVQIYRALTPSVAQSEGNELANFNRQILPADDADADAKAELGQRTVDDQEARQPQIVLNVSFPMAYAQVVQPHDAKWYKFTIADTDNNRGISYTTSTRWICRSVTIAYNIKAGTLTVNGQFKQETQGSGYQTLVTTPIVGNVVWFNPVTPVAPAYVNFPEAPGSGLPDPDNPSEDDEPPFTPEDLVVANTPEDPNTALAQLSAATGGIVWDDISIWQVWNIPSSPEYGNITPTGFDAGTETITDVLLDQNDSGIYAISNNGTSTNVWRSSSLGSAWTSVSLTNVYKLLVGDTINDAVYVYGNSPAVVNPTIDFSTPSDYSFPSTTGETDPLFFIMNASSLDVSPPAGSSSGGNAAKGGSIYDSGLGGGARYRKGAMAKNTNFSSGQTISEVTLEGYRGGGTLPSGNAIAWLVEFYNSSGTRVGYFRTTAALTNSTWTSKTLTTANLTDSNENVVYVYAGIQNSSGSTFTNDYYIDDIVITTGVGGTNTRYSTNKAATFESAVVVGIPPTGDADGGAATGERTPDKIFAAQDEKIRNASEGGAYSDQSGGTTTGTYAKCIKGIGTGANDYFFGTAAAIAGETLWEVDNGSETAITPNDGANDGIVVSARSIMVNGTLPERILTLCDFGGTTKLAYSGDAGATWTFNTQISNNAVYISGRVVNDLTYIYIADGTTLWFGTYDGTNAITLQDKFAPSGALKGVHTR
jgi:hypothetical protein